jgi:anion-transporting  ArsA/GET3 family ATPase
MAVMPRLTIFLGGGGVGKTTLSAALGLARARAGAHVGLLSIDPARRLRSALHLEAMDEMGVVLPSGDGELRAALVEPEVCLRRWASEACTDESARTRLFADPLFGALASRLAGATDAIAAARAAEWAERDPKLDELIIDTAPGLPGIELLARPEKLLAMLSDRVLGLFRHAALGGRLLGGLARIAGVDSLQRMGDFLTLFDKALQQLAHRLQHAKKWLRSANVIVVAAVSSDAAHSATDIAKAVRGLSLSPGIAILNRALPPSASVAATEVAASDFLRYVEHYRSLQTRVAAELAGNFSRVLSLPESGRVDLQGADGLDGLADLGATLIAEGLA